MQQVRKVNGLMDVLLGLIACATFAHAACDEEEDIAEIEVTSPAFKDGTIIPIGHTCDGTGVSPPLLIVGAPIQAETVAITVEDPDAVLEVFTHWILWGIPPRSSILLVQDYGSYLDQGVVQGKNSSGEIGYLGLCPPKGQEHRYFFNAYALDIELDLSEKTSPGALAAAMRGHIIGQGQLMGRYGH